MLLNLKEKKISQIAVSIIIISAAIFLLTNNVLAAQLNVGLEFGQATGLGSQDIRVIIANIIRIVLGFLGIIAVALIIYAGWLWMSSQGNEEKVLRAKAVLRNAVIGLIIILASFALASFILNKLISATTMGVGTGPGAGGGGGGIGASLGSGIIESHYPARNQTNVPRNTRIIITFKEAIDPTTLETVGNINANNVKIYLTSDGLSGTMVTQVTSSHTADNKTFSFKPSQYLGNATEKVWYSVALTTNITKANGDQAFPGVVGLVGYDWSFEVGNYIDDTPPQVQSIVPQAGATEPRNVVMQINFTEAVDPTAASGRTASGFNNLVVTNSTDNQTVSGIFYISNQYRTVEFLTEDVCGVNSCGNTIYCLPGGKELVVLVKAATLVIIGEAAAVFPYDGIADMAGNSLDGNKNNAAQGPQAQSNQPPYNENNPSASSQGDDYSWTFNTNNLVDITAPVIINIIPDVAGSGVALDTNPEARFNKLLMSTSINTTSVKLTSNPPAPLNYWINKSDNLTDKQTTVIIGHDQFDENTGYSPLFTSAIKDIYQNCYSPCSGMGVSGNPSCCNGAPTAAGTCP